VRSSSVEFCKLAQWVAVPEREEGGLVLVKQTFVGPLDVLDEANRLRAVSEYVKTGTLALAESHQVLIVLSLSISSSLTA